MSEGLVEEEVEERKDEVEQENKLEPSGSDEEDDYEGYFLEPVGNSINLAEKIAEANKKLLEEEDDDENRPRKVHFGEDLVNFEPTYYSDDDYTESTRNSIISEEDSELKLNNEEEEENEIIEEPPTEAPVVTTVEDEYDNPKSEDEIAEELDTDAIPIPEECTEEIVIEEFNETSNKLLLVLLPKEQNSSCESILGEENIENKNLEEEKPKEEKPVRIKIARPKSAKKSCDVSKISPNLNYSSSLERRSWRGCRTCSSKAKSQSELKEKNIFRGEIRVEISGKTVKKVNIDNLNLEGVRKGEELRRCCDNRPKSCEWSRSDKIISRPKTGSMKRTCCVIKTELPQYNGLRSEYGLSAEQLQERKQKTLELKHQRKREKLKEREEEIKKKNENEEIFQRWLFSKSKKHLSRKPIKLTDTLTRSDVYIQSHASYAANRSVPYSVDYSLTKKSHKRKDSPVKRSKTIFVDKLLDKVSPHFKRSFNIYLGVRL